MKNRYMRLLNNFSCGLKSSTPSESAKDQIRSILAVSDKGLSPEAHQNKNVKNPRLKKVHFHLPKTSSSNRKLSSLDSNSSIVHQWLSLMIFPLSYEMWAFPYRLALGVPSTTSALCYADASFDCFFLVDMFISLITALPPIPGREEVVSFPGIASHYFSQVFPYQILPCCVYWILTPICASNFEGLCAGPQVAAGESSFECLIGSFSWGLWLWWGASVLRVVPRLLRLLALFKHMESNLVLVVCILECTSFHLCHLPCPCTRLH